MAFAIKRVPILAYMPPHHSMFLSASLYVSKRALIEISDARLCCLMANKDFFIGCVVTSLVGWLVGCHARALWPNGAS